MEVLVAPRLLAAEVRSQAADQLVAVVPLVLEVADHQAAACLAWAAEGCRLEEGRSDGTRTDR